MDTCISFLLRKFACKTNPIEGLIVNISMNKQLLYYTIHSIRSKVWPESVAQCGTV